MHKWCCSVLARDSRISDQILPIALELQFHAVAAMFGAKGGHTCLRWNIFRYILPLVMLDLELTRSFRGWYPLRPRRCYCRCPRQPIACEPILRQPIPHQPIPRQPVQAIGFSSWSRFFSRSHMSTTSSRISINVESSQEVEARSTIPNLGFVMLFTELSQRVFS